LRVKFGGAADYVAGIAIYTGIGMDMLIIFPTSSRGGHSCSCALFNTIHSIVIDSERFRFTIMHGAGLITGNILNISNWSFIA
jgi:hypothetical protein